MRNNSTLRGGGEDAKELRREEKGDNNDKWTEVKEGGNRGKLK